jgi:hypothetical protein
MALASVAVWLLAGVMIAIALARRERISRVALLARAPMYVLLWPLFAPLLVPSSASPGSSAGTPWDARIAEAGAALAEALSALSARLDDPLSLEHARVALLGGALRAAAARAVELADVLRRPENDAEVARRELVDAAPDGSLAEVLRRRLTNVERLTALHRQAQADLERALAEASALATRLTLLRYETPGDGTAAAARARELTDSVDDLCRVLADARAA